MPCQSDTHSRGPVWICRNPHGFGGVSLPGGSSPEENSVTVPARAAYSHSASVGRRYCFPSLRLSQLQNNCASSQLIPVANPGNSRPLSKKGLNCLYCSSVTSNSDIAKEYVIRTWWVGRSSQSPCGLSARPPRRFASNGASWPIRNDPGSMRTIFMPAEFV